MKQGDIIYAKALAIIGTGSELNGVVYNPFDGKANIESKLAFLAQEDVNPTGVQIPLFIGFATNPPERKKLLAWSFGDKVGVYVGKLKYLNGIAYAKITVQLRAYTGSGDDYPVDAQVWVRSSDITNDQNVLTDLVDNGQSGGITNSELKAKRNTDSSTVGTGTGKSLLGTTTSKNTILYVLGGLILAGLGYLFFRNK